MAGSEQENLFNLIIKEITEQFQPIMDRSPFGVYFYLDDIHKVCNEKFASMFGVTPREFAEMPMFLQVFISEKDQATFARNYHHNIVEHAHPVNFRFTARRKDGSTFEAETDMIPLCWRGYPIAYHFLHEVNGR